MKILSELVILPTKMALTPQARVLRGDAIVRGAAFGNLIACDEPLSFWGGVDPSTGKVIDRFHPLSGRYLKDAILAIPGGKGSCGGSVIMMELILNGLGPKALVFERREEIITLGVIVAEEFFGKTAPVLILSPSDFRQVLSWDAKSLHIHGEQVSNEPLDIRHSQEPIVPEINFGSLNVRLDEFDRATLGGVHGEAARVAMKIIVRMAEIIGAKELIDISQAHVDSAWYGPGSVAFGERLLGSCGQFRVPTTLNALTIDQRGWRALGVEIEYGSTCDKLAKTFLKMGGSVSFTCAPYLLETAPKFGDSVSWGESNAVCYANSILGARTLKSANMLECCSAITGRTPKSGVCIDENRLASICIRVQTPRGVDDSFWPILGYSTGAIAGSQIPVLTGVEGLKPTRDDLKAFSAAFATAASAPMFHMVNQTPEAPTLEAACSKNITLPLVDLTWKALRHCWDEFNRSPLPRQVDLISLGNPHFSLQEIGRLAQLCAGKEKQEDVAVVVTCGRAQHALAAQAGHVDELKKFGVQFLTDTCWCFIQEPVITKPTRVIMTTSGKYVHYGPGLTGKDFCFGGLEMCVDVACSGRSSGRPPQWLQNALLS